MTASRPKSTHELLSSERRFLSAMTDLEFGRFEGITIYRGEVVLDPWPFMIHNVKFGAEPATPRTSSEEFELKRQVAELFEYLRAVEAGQIRCLEVRHGLPFSMEIEHRRDGSGDRRG